MAAVVTDEEVYSRVLQGDLGALEILVHRYHAMLQRFLYRQTGDRHLAEDLVQDTFARLVTYAGRPPTRFRPWAFTMAANLTRDHFRSAYHRREQPDAMAVWGEAERSRAAVDDAPGADELLLRDADRREVVEALQSLSPVHREVLVLRFYHELPLQEIAEVTDSPLGTVKSRLFHALKHMKARLGEEGGHRDEAATWGLGSRTS